MIKTIFNEPVRGCGLRKKGGLYLVSGGLALPCGKLPLPLGICPACGAGIKFSRGWTWIDPRPLTANLSCRSENCGACPLGTGIERAGLLWIGEKFYKTTAAFTREAAAQGVSRRVHSIPRDFKIGETWILIAHIKAIRSSHPFTPDLDDPVSACVQCGENGDTHPELKEQFGPGIFHAFRPSAIEYIVTGKETQEQLNALEKRGVTLIDLVRTDGMSHEGLTDQPLLEAPGIQ